LGDFKNLGYLINNARTSITPSVSADGKYFFFQAKSPEVYFDSLDRRLNFDEFQKNEISFPVNNGRDIYWVETGYIDMVKKLEFTSISSALLKKMENENIKAAINLYWELKEKNIAFCDFSESMLNRLGYRLLEEKKYKEAIEIFKLNIEVHPKSSNVYDSLGEAYMEDDQVALALENYEKSLELNPKNTNALEMLKKIDKK